MNEATQGSRPPFPPRGRKRGSDGRQMSFVEPPLLRTIVLSVLVLIPIGAVNAQIVDENNGWNTYYVSSLGATGSSFYAQSFLANVATITKFGVVIKEIEAEGELVLAIAADNGSGAPDVNAPLYQGVVRNPSTTGAWFYEAINVSVTVGQKYWVLIDGHNNAGATGRSAIGLSVNYTSTNEGMIYSNTGGVGTWSSIPTMPLAIYVEGANAPVINNGWNSNYVSSIGAIGSDFYAQSFRATVGTITKFGVVIAEIGAEGEVVLAIASDSGSGTPDVNALLYEGALRNPSPNGAWFYEEGIGIPVTVGEKYWVLIDGYNNAGATGVASIGVSSNYTNTNEGMRYSNAGGAGAWSSIASMPLAVFVAGTVATVRFSVSAPGAAVMGTPFSFTVTAKDPLDNTDIGYPGTVHFSSSDGSASLPADATLTNGVGSFSATLSTPGSQTITATDMVASSITGTCNTILVGCASDVTPPGVTAPAAIVLDQTVCCGTAGGATAATSAALDAFLAGGSATDECTLSPTRLPPRAAGVDVTSETCFDGGTTTVAFRFQDSFGNVGSANSTATVRMFGDLNSDGAVDPSDMVVLRAYFNFAVLPGSPPFSAPLGTADLNHDAVVDPTDLVLLRAYFNFVVGCLT